MRVAIDTTPLLRAPSGTATYVARLVEALEDLGVEVIPLRDVDRPGGRAGSPHRGPAGVARSGLNLAARRRWAHRRLPALAAHAGAEVLHHPLPALSPRFAGAQTCTVHDLAYERLPGAFDPAWRAWARVAHRRAALRADRVLCVSAATALDARVYWGLDLARISVSHLGVEAPATAGSGGRPPPGSPFLLAVADAEPRKNLSALIDAYRAARSEAGGDAADLCIAGSGARALSAEPGLVPYPDPSAEELDRLLREAVALVHPSLAEGFGLPPLEAMARGTPVLAARVPALVEVLGDAAAYFDPRDAADLGARLREALAGDAGLALLAARGLERARAFTWRACAEVHAEAFAAARDGARKATARRSR